MRKHSLIYLTQRLGLYLSYLGAQWLVLCAVRDPKKVAKMADLVMRELGCQVAKVSPGCNSEALPAPRGTDQ
jgi:hypothetical protein